MSNSESLRVLTKEEMEEIFSDWDNPESKEKLFNHNMRLAHYIARKYTNTSFDYEDLIQMSCIGLWKAIKTFDPTKGFQFATYATRVMTNEILMSLRSAKKCPLIDDMRVISIQSPIGIDVNGNELTVEELLTDGIEIDEELVESELKKTLEHFIKIKYGKDPKKLEVIDLYLSGKNQKRIASITGISQSYVSRIENKFKKDFKKYYDRICGNG